ncbi:MAG TPA: hypothetical protein VLE69_03990 [Candidatus Saccharimonadales bacterium]|nr:hypothetical protein [Candidatus Saccharimonadales bacterium]
MGQKEHHNFGGMKIPRGTDVPATTPEDLSVIRRAEARRQSRIIGETVLPNLRIDETPRNFTLAELLEKGLTLEQASQFLVAGTPVADDGEIPPIDNSHEIEE